MKSILTLLAIAASISASAQTKAKENSSGGYPVTPVSFTHVHIAGNTFWGQRLQASQDVTIPLAFSKSEETGRYTNFSNAAEHIKDPSKVFTIKSGTFSFDDTDPYKTIEGASYLLQTYPNAKFKGGRLDKYVDSVVAVIASGQEPDGYLYTSRTQNPQHPHEWAGTKRWERVEDLSHEFYNLGHMCEAAVAHYYATGKRNFLDVAIKYADCICREVGDKAGQASVVPGHQIAEMGLAKLYIATGNRKYLEEAKFFLDKRGKKDPEWRQTRNGLFDKDGYYHRLDTYSQSHKPVTEQDEAVGHAVRAGYMYAGMADIAALTGDKEYIKAIDRIWENIVSKKYYITGGVGATSSGEAFGDNYELPNMSAYCETCAAIAQVYLNYRLFLLHGESKYYDALERSLYNGVISGVSLDGGRFFYPNPLESMGQHQRQAWFGCACCPSNIARFIPSVPGYFYQVQNNDVFVNLFCSNTADLTVGGKKVTLSQQTEYPWKGDIHVTIDKTNASEFNLRLRIPGWVRGQVVPSDLYSYADNKQLNYSVTVNGQPVEADLQQGYFGIKRKWKKGDKVTLHLDMQPRIVTALDAVEADRGRVSIECGPIVYCAEFADNDFDLGSLLLNQKPQFKTKESQMTIKADDGMHTYQFQGLSTSGQTLNYNEEGRLVAKDVTLNLIPYYAWNHRGSGRMLVWLPIELRATTPAKPATLASKSKLSVSTRTAAVGSVNDGLLPKSSNDKSVPYYHWWPKQGGTEWLQYDLPTETSISSTGVYWYDDGPWGGCRIPKAWRIFYMDANNQWQPVKVIDAYTVKKDNTNTVHFQPVTTKALKMEVDLPDDNSAGLYEWDVE